MMFGIHKSSLFIIGAFLSIVVSFMLFQPPLSHCEDLNTDPKATVTVEKKERFSVVTSKEGQIGESVSWEMMIYADGYRYHILPQLTRIYDPQGKALTMDGLVVPCEAEISYQPLKDYTRNALTIRVKQNLKGATAKWPAADPR